MKKKRGLWCRLVGCKLVIVRDGFPHEDAWFVRCDRFNCSMATITVKGSPWPNERLEPFMEAIG